MEPVPEAGVAIPQMDQKMADEHGPGIVRRSNISEAARMLFDPGPERLDGVRRMSQPSRVIRHYELRLLPGRFQAIDWRAEITLADFLVIKTDVGQIFGKRPPQQ